MKANLILPVTDDDDDHDDDGDGDGDADDQERRQLELYIAKVKRQQATQPAAAFRLRKSPTVYENTL